MRFLAALFVVAACSKSSSEREPAGTPTDPVETCERLADVCRYDGAKLGVCIEAPADRRPERCEPGAPCFVCAPQH